MIQVFTTNENGKIELTKEELKKLLDEAYWEGYKNNNSFTYISPSWHPYMWTNTSSPSVTYPTITCNSETTTLCNTPTSAG